MRFVVSCQPSDFVFKPAAQFNQDDLKHEVETDEDAVWPIFEPERGAGMPAAMPPQGWLKARVQLFPDVTGRKGSKTKKGTKAKSAIHTPKSEIRTVTVHVIADLSGSVLIREEALKTLLYQEACQGLCRMLPNNHEAYTFEVRVTTIPEDLPQSMEPLEREGRIERQ